MHYYQFNIGDYASHTAHLEPLEDIAYRRMIDYCYLNEIGLPKSKEEIGRLIRMRTHSDCIANVLREFFTLEGDCYFHKRVEKDIEKYKSKSDKAKESANARWSKTKASTDANALRPECEGNANHKPLTINQEPPTNNQSISPAKAGKRKTSLSPDFILTKHKAGLAMKYWSGKGRTDLDVREIFDQFTTYCKANGKNYLDWDSAWQTWYVNAVKFERGNQNGAGQQFGQKTLSKSERRDAQARAYLDENNDDGVAWSTGNEVSP